MLKVKSYEIIKYTVCTSVPLGLQLMKHLCGDMLILLTFMMYHRVDILSVT